MVITLGALAVGANTMKLLVIAVCASFAYQTTALVALHAPLQRASAAVRTLHVLPKPILAQRTITILAAADATASEEPEKSKSWIPPKSELKKVARATSLDRLETS